MYEGFPFVSLIPLTVGWTEVGTLEIDANTGCVLTESPSFSALWKRFRALLGIEDFPADKQARLSELLELNNDGALTFEQKGELEQLMNEADAQEALNLQRLASRLPDRKRKNERTLEKVQNFFKGCWHRQTMKGCEV
jgi:hypothetical protein